MDVNGVGQNSINLYNADSNVSQYTVTNSDLAVQQVQKVEAQPSLENKPKEEQYKKEDVDKALKKINNFLKDEKTHAEYSVHKDFGTVMIKIINEETKEVILEVPPKKILDIVASMCKQVGLLDKKA